DYATPIGPAVTTSIVQLDKTPSKLFLNSTLIDLEKAGFEIPGEEGNNTLILTIGDTPVLTQKIYVSKAIVFLGITPVATVAGKNTDFIVKLQNSSKIKKYLWNFGDGKSIETNKNTASHRYNRTGTFEVIVSAEDNSGFSASKSFSMDILNPKESVNTTLALYKSRFKTSSEQINSLPEWYSISVKENLKSDEWSENLKEIEKNYVSAVSESDYIKAMEALDTLTIPSKINLTALRKTPALIETEDIELELLKEAGAGEGEGQEEDYKNALERWFNNLNAIVEYKEIKAYYEDKIETIGIAGTIKIAKENEGSVLVIFDNPSIILNTGKAKKISERSILEAENLDNFAVEFFIPENIDLQEPIFYASPELSTLDISKPVSCNNNKVCEKERGENKENCINDCKPVSRSLIYIGIVVLLGVGAYFGLKWWYRWKYEAYLFKNRADLANLMSFTRNAFEQGKDEREVIKLLKDNSWNSEQIDYAIKKTIGKNTGM
ncbi:MAG: PKD domain-containing protein, partial [Nanoarchaeota archaeon]